MFTQYFISFLYTYCDPLTAWYSELDDDRVLKFNKILTVVYPDYRESHMMRYKYFCNFAEYGLALFSKTLNRESNLVKVIKFLWYAPVFLFFPSMRQSQFKEFICSEDFDLMMKIAKASGNSFSKFACYFINPRIKFHKKIYIPRNYEKLTPENLNQTLDKFMNKKTNKIHSRYFDYTKKLRGAESFCVRTRDRLSTRSNTFEYKNERNLLLLSKPNCLNST